MSMTAISGSHVLHLLPTLLIGVVLTAALALPHRALAGLRCYYAAAGAPGDVAGRGKKVKARKGGSSGAASSKREEDIDLGGAEALVVATLTVRQVDKLAYHGAFENLIITSFFALTSLAVNQAAERVVGWPGTPLPAVFAYGACLVSLLMLAQVDLLSATTAPSNKVVAAVWGLCGFGAALGLHVLQPAGGSVLAWDTQRAAAAVGPTIIAIVKAAGSKALRDGHSPIPQLSMTASTLQVLLALAAAAIAVLLYTPALRFVRSYWLQQTPPEWAGDYITARPAATAALHLQLLLPLLASVLWVRPMCQELFRLSDQQLLLVQAAALLAIAAVMAANLRTLLQRYLDKALTGWHQLKHGTLAARAKKDEKRTLGDQIRAGCQATNFLLGKAAVQTLAPATLYLGMGLLLLTSALHPGTTGSPEAETQALVQTCVGFLAAWTGVCWFVYSAVTLWMFRTGVLQA